MAVRQRRHRFDHLFGRGVVAASSAALMSTGLYPVVPYLVRRGAGGLRALAAEWAAAVGSSVARPLGFAPLPGATGRGPRPIIVLHGFAMNRANFWLLARRLARAGLGPIVGFEYWTLGRTSTAARELARFVDEVRAATGAAEVDLIGHSMGGLVGRYYVGLGGGDGVVKHLVTIGSPHGGTEMSRFGVGRAAKELMLGSALLARLAAAPAPTTTRLTAIWSRADALVPGSEEARLDGAEELVFDDLGHLSLLGSRRVAAALIARLR
ncbi:MAG: alpha/beta fold hydrolase [Kofleriaceae bacterium]